jgi:ribose/xylose/arabinose/galactoside ABC-type transport system permease subunit
MVKTHCIGNLNWYRAVQNACLKIVLNVHPFIATLAMQLTLRGLALVISKGANVSGFPTTFSCWDKAFLGHFDTDLDFAALIIVFGYLLKYLCFFNRCTSSAGIQMQQESPVSR